MRDGNFLSEFINEEIYLIDLPAEKPSQYLIVIPDVLSTEETAFLHKVFKAIDIAPEQLLITNKALEDGNYLATFYFGTAPANMSINHYEKHLLRNKPTVVADSLSEIAGDHDKKRKLWSVLQTCFS